MGAPPLVFICSDPEDHEIERALVAHLRSAERQGFLRLWTSACIRAAETMDDGVQAAIAEASVAVFVVSADFLGSEDIQEKQVGRILSRTPALQTVSFVARPCDWSTPAWLDSIDIRLNEDRAVSQGPDVQVEEDLTTVAREVRSLLGITWNLDKRGRVTRARSPRWKEGG